MHRMLSGKSGCSVSICEWNGKSIVRKQAQSPQYKLRLQKQCEKQKAFQTEVSGITVPDVLFQENDSFGMEYLRMLNAVEFIEMANTQDLCHRFEILILFLKEEFSKSIERQVSATVFEKKLLDIEKRCLLNPKNGYYGQTIQNILQRLDSEYTIPIGNCHGDLTLSNVMFSLSEARVGLIDFLDSFIDSPLVDLVKLGQDAEQYWSSFICDRDHDRTKYQIAMMELKKRINSVFAEFIKLPVFPVFKQLNYLRIAPYLESEKEHCYLKNVLVKLAKEK